MIYTQNKLLNISKQPVIPGWAKELCYRTLNKGVLGDDDIQEVFNIFTSNSAPTTPVPAESPKQTLRILSMMHEKGVNALKDNSELVFCEEGMTILYGQNATGKSGYFRVLEHLAGGRLASPVLQNIYAEHPESPLCKIRYSINDVPQPEYTWDNTDAAKGQAPFNKIAVFNSKYAEHLLKQHSPDTYIVDMYGMPSINQFKQNFDKIMDKVAEASPDRWDDLSVPELINLSCEAAMIGYLQALRSQLANNINRLLGKNIGIVVDLVQNDDTPELVIKLDKPYTVESILSEGEQKAIALALIISDAEIREEKNPIIFDDPVNSLDNKIICKFVDMVMELDNQIIIFSHNFWFVELFMNSNSSTVFKSIDRRSQRTSSKKHIIAYRVTASTSKRGFLTDYKKECAQSYLERAKSYIDTEPFSDDLADEAKTLLRKAVEFLVDEKIFLNLVPCKYRIAHPDIQWKKFSELKNIPDDTIETLKSQYAILSDRGSHIGMAAMEDRLEHDELVEIYNKLVAL